jgi:hypothetical protein
MHVLSHFCRLNIVYRLHNIRDVVSTLRLSTYHFFFESIEIIPVIQAFSLVYKRFLEKAAHVSLYFVR